MGSSFMTSKINSSHRCLEQKRTQHTFCCFTYRRSPSATRCFETPSQASSSYVDISI